MTETLRPTSEAEVADAVRGADGPVWIRGGGTRLAADDGAVLDVSGLSGIVLYEPGALTLVAQAGTPLAEIEQTLAREGQRLAFEPADWRGLTGLAGTPTIGGVAAANVSGPRRVQVGAARDAMIGVRFVDGTGMVVANGGRVMKNVTGYDLVKLVAGSWGQLGVLTEVAFKLLPTAESVATMILPVADASDAVAAMADALVSPFDVTGAAMLPGTGVLIRIEGFAGSVAYRQDQLATRIGRFGAVEVERDRERHDTLWRAVREVQPFHGRAGDVWRFSVTPSAAPGICARLGDDVVLDWGGGLIWALLPEGTDARALARPYPGHATLVRGAARDGRRFEPEAAGVRELTESLRARFDPRGIFNRGLQR